MRHRPEERLEREILLALGNDPTLALYTNPTGQGFYAATLPQIGKLLAGTPYCKPALEALYRNRVTYGLGVGSPDLVGIGRGGRFVGLELKAGTRASSAQLQWHDAARQRGALIAVVRSVDEAREMLEE